MASFRTHFSIGIVLGAVGALMVVALALVPTDWRFAGFIALVIVVGALVPDMDSDSSVPFHVTFGTLAVIAAGLSLLYALQVFPGDYARLIGYPLGALFVVWIIIGSIFKKFTCHRGMAHSIPAAALAGLFVFSFSTFVGFDEWRSFLVGLVLTLGYLSHLILDEVYAAVNFHNQPFIPNKAFGSALKFFSHRRIINVIVYGLVVCLLAVKYQNFSELTLRLVRAVH